MCVPGMLSCTQSVNQKKIGIQLYTLKDIIRKDVYGTLKQVAGIGFTELESYDYENGIIFNIPFQDFSAMVKDLGLSLVSGHYGTNTAFGDKWEQAVEDALKAGQKYMIIASLNHDDRQTLDGYKRVCERMNQANEICRKAGIMFGYHNHEYEFESLEGQIPYDVMAKELDDSIVLELDIYWSTFSGMDAIELFKKYTGRIHLWHVKDMDREKRTRQTDVGSGSIDYATIFQAAEVSGMKHFFLEQEYFNSPPMEAITRGYKHLSSIS